MSNFLIPPLCFRELDNNGLPLAGGKVYSYAAGTTTPAATYTDSTGATQNTNPVTLNARGEANIWIPVGQAYKFVVTDSNGVTIRTDDNVTTAPATSGSFVVTATGFSGTAPSGTINWYQNGNVVTANLFGALGGTSNDVTFTLTGIPTALQPATTASYFAVASALNSGSAVSTAYIEIPNGEGTWHLGLAGSLSGWTASGTKRVTSFSVTYLLL